MNWTAKYINVPYLDGGRNRNGVDCWGLVRLVYASELNIDLPSYGEISAEDLIKVARNIDAGKDGETWVDVAAEETREFDVCVMRFAGTKRVGHVGIVTPHGILHVEKGVDAAIVSQKHHTIRERIACFRRHKLTIK